MAILACVYTFVLTTKLCICVKKNIYVYIYSRATFAYLCEKLHDTVVNPSQV